MEPITIERGNAKKRGANIYQFRMLEQKVTALEARLEKLETVPKKEVKTSIKTGGNNAKTTKRKRPNK